MSAYRAMARPATAPMMPISMVIRQPIGWRPGTASRPRPPMTSPTKTAPRMLSACMSSACHANDRDGLGRQRYRGVASDFPVNRGVTNRDVGRRQHDLSDGRAQREGARFGGEVRQHVQPATPYDDPALRRIGDYGHLVEPRIAQRRLAA